MGQCVGEVGWFPSWGFHAGCGGRGAGGTWRVEEGRGWWWGDEVGASVAAGEAFAYYAGAGDEVGEAFVAAEGGGGGGGEEGGWCRGGGGGACGGDC